MRKVEYKVAKTFEEIVNDNGKNFFECFVFSGLSVRKVLIKAKYGSRNEYWWRYENVKGLTVQIYDMYGRITYGSNFFRIEKKETDTNILIYDNGKYFSLSRDNVYQECLKNLRKKMLDLKKKEIAIHDKIYSL